MSLLLELTLFGNVLWSLVAFVGFFIVLILCEVYEDGWWNAAMLVIVSLMIYFGNSELFQQVMSVLTLTNITVYLVFGLIYAFIRTFFFGREQEQNSLQYKIDNPTYTHGYTKEKVTEHFSRWWFAWWVSLPVWSLQKGVKKIVNYTIQRLGGVIKFIEKMGAKSVK